MKLTAVSNMPQSSQLRYGSQAADAFDGEARAEVSALACSPTLEVN